MIRLVLLGLLVALTALTAYAFSAPPQPGPKVVEQKLVSPTGEKVDMGREFTADTRRYEQQADKIIAGAPSYRAAQAQLAELQRHADSAWKGHGPRILARALQRLNSSPLAKGEKNKMIKKVAIIAANEDGKPIRRKNIGECRFYADYSFKIKCDRPEIARQLAAAIDQARRQESLLLRTEAMVGDRLVMSGEMVGPGDQDYVHALVIEAARLLNNDTRGEYFSLEP